ncbi:helix-turn-helix domain-containing protein [Weissella paramesenteroides]|jgi:transcriptional regulator with XRE-family HTH domain|uniref:helix-turn-helix domain-containing protein n=1 Tax=Weissella paramesenteroides TaxID=1249 RepID=UPI00207306A2|nr:helix-turn-helix domain-containing protein [Weissella paramesenteroides]MCM6765922.1 helix-turn-helix domain-containing protein [Weissella paramesenteroides]MCM6767297.1 helix-turn-helix domain-containing protein [Weissella paramesenteroides]MCM6771632.1 helix-turn-helix domain-containing protein [Weissella paramesenteroides]MCM6779275.1 helix-turn-helix domain-containing protein [Weissella paramesenteroides]MCM6781493.1 helix-turn-helix domain-containing protein [Weissella paramesenteroide
MTTFERIKQTAKERGLTLNQLNDTAKLKNNIIYSWKSKTPSAENLSKVADVLGVSVDYLLGNTDDMHANKNATANEPVDLDDLLSEKGMAMFDGQPLSDEYKKALLAMLNTMKDNGK